jgi:hypothetical protein
VRRSSAPRKMAPSVNTNVMPDRPNALTADPKLLARTAQKSLKLADELADLRIRIQVRAVARALLRFDAKPGHVEGRQEHQGEQRRDHEAANDRVGRGPPEHGGAIGIIPRMAAAVSRIGRNRCSVSPTFRSVSPIRTSLLDEADGGMLAFRMCQTVGRVMFCLRMYCGSWWRSCP